jgi:phage shock protein A
MKKLLLLFAAVGMIFAACEQGGGPDNGGNGDLSLNKIATIEEQGANIKATIATLETTKSAVNATIATLNEQQPVTRGSDNGNNGVKDMIAALEERLAALEQMIANLKEYADGDLSEIQDWAEATFATMEQYNALASELATLKALLEGLTNLK